MAYINLTKAMEEYAEEKAWMAAEEMAWKAAEQKLAIDPLWDNWYGEAFFLEPDGKVDIVIEKDTTDEPKSKSKNMPKYRKDRSKRANRRRQTHYHKVKIKRNAEVILDSYYKRSEEDQRNGKFCKKRGGQRVTCPKSLTMKSEKLLKIAEKMQLITDESTVENTQNLENIGTTESKAA